MIKILFFVLVLTAMLFAIPINVRGVIRSAETDLPINDVVISLKNYPSVAQSDSLGIFKIIDSLKNRLYINNNNSGISSKFYLNGNTLKWGKSIDLQEVSLFSLNGRRLFNHSVRDENRRMKFPELAKGVIVLSLRIGEKRYTKKFIPGTNISFSFDIKSRNNYKRQNSDSLTLLISHPDYITKEKRIRYDSKDFSVYLSQTPDAEIFSQKTVHTYSVNISEDVFDSLQKNAKAEFFVPCTLSFNGEAVGIVGVRYQGSDYHLDLYFDENGKNDVVPKVSFKFKFNEYDPNKRFYGLKRLIFNAMDTDPTCIRNSLSYSLFNDMGIHSCRTAYARLEINGKYEGLFLILEPIDGEFLDKRFSGYGDGNLYKEIWPGNSHRNNVLFNLKTKEYVGNINGMMEFDSTVREMTKENFTTEITNWTDLDYLLKFLAVDRAVIAIDGIMTWYIEGKFAGNHNYYWYEENMVGGKFYLLPWDYDATFYAPDGLFDIAGVPRWNEEPVSDTFTIYGESKVIAPSTDNLIYLLGQTCWERYVDIANEFLNNQFSKENLVKKIENWKSLIGPHLKDDPNISGYHEWQNAIDALSTSIDYYRGRFEKLLEGPDTLTIADPDLTPFNTYTGLWYERDNNFEFTTDPSPLPYVNAYGNEGTVCTIELNDTDALSGNRDVKLTTCFNPTDGNWSEWAVFSFYMNKSSYDISNVKRIAITAKANRAATVRVVVLSDAYPDPYGVKYGSFISVDTIPKVFKLDPDLMYYPDWDSQADVKNEVFLSCSGIDIIPDAAFLEMGELLSPDTVILNIDDIRFIK